MNERTGKRLETRLISNTLPCGVEIANAFFTEDADPGGRLQDDLDFPSVYVLLALFL